MNRHNRFLSILFLILFSYFNGLSQERPDSNLNHVITDTKGIETVEDGLSFLAIGDFGRHGHFTQQEVARDMGSVAEILDLTFTVSVGDNFYPNGVQSTQDYQWISSYESIYTHHLLHEPWYVALGNHDYEGIAQAQIDYTKVSRRWEMPNHYFERMIEIDDNQYLQLLVIDTNPFVKKYHNEPEKYVEIAEQNTEKQLKWLNERLQNNDPKIVWKVVVGHHPLYSGGKRKTSEETVQVRDIFQPIFNQHQVDAYICGHEHDLQIIKKKNDTFTQFLSGAGSELRETGFTEGTLYAEAVPGFMAFAVTADKLKVYVIKSGKNDFEVSYQSEITK